MSAGFPASVAGSSSLFPNLPRSVVSNSPTSIAAILQQHIPPPSSSTLSGGGSGVGYGTVAYPAPNSFLGNPYFAAAFAAAAASSSSSPAASSPFTGFLNSSDKHQQQQQRIKLKRTRQRVDAGEPRNTYSSFIPAYQKAPTIPFSTSTSIPISRQSISDSSISRHLPSAETSDGLFANSFLLGQSPQSNPSYVHNLLRGMHFQQQSATDSNLFQSSSNNGVGVEGNQWTPLFRDSKIDEIKNEKSINGNSEKTSPLDESPSPFDDADFDDRSSPSPPKKRSRSSNAAAAELENGIGMESEKKIDSPNSTSGPINGNETTAANRSKRKQYQPQQLDVNTSTQIATGVGGEREDDERVDDPLLLSMTTTDFDNSENGDDEEDEDLEGKSLNGLCDDDDQDDDELIAESKNSKTDQNQKANVNEENELESGDEGTEDDGLDEGEQLEMQQIKRMQNELMFMQQRYIEALAASQQQQQKQQQQQVGQRVRGDEKETATSNNNVEKVVETKTTVPLVNGNSTDEKIVSPVVKDIKLISDGLKSDLYTSVCNIVDDWMQRMQKSVQAEAARLNSLTPILGQHQAPPPPPPYLGRQHMPPGWPSQIDISTANQRSTVPPPTTATTAPISNLGSAVGGAAAPTPILFGPPPPPVVSQGQRNSPMPPANAPNGPRPQFYFNPFYYNSFPYASAGLNFAAAAAAAAAASGHQAPPPTRFMTSPAVSGAPPNTVSTTPASTIFPTFSSSSGAPGPAGSNHAGSVNHQNQSPYMGLNLSHKSGNGSMNKILDDQASTPSNSLPMPRKKRSKVTDTRVTKLSFRGDDLGQLHAAVAAAHQLGVGGSPVSGAGSFFASGAYPPTLLPPHLLNPHHHQSPFATQISTGLAASVGGGRGSSNFDDSDLGAVSPDNNSDGTGSEMTPYDPNMPQSVTLTPMHLRKAKLMFFYTRYPSSALLKAYFPDIRFNKNNTAQLVKWFSNFREFYYIQMEKYARQALAEGVRSTSEIHVLLDSELYKVLNLHYNRNNHIQVPTNFRGVVEATLKEFFLAIQASRDAEPSWKKAIYKVIARLDDPIPEYFKTPNFLEQLE